MAVADPGRFRAGAHCASCLTLAYGARELPSRSRNPASHRSVQVVNPELPVYSSRDWGLDEGGKSWLEPLEFLFQDRVAARRFIQLLRLAERFQLPRSFERRLGSEVTDHALQTVDGLIGYLGA